MDLLTTPTKPAPSAEHPLRPTLDELGEASFPASDPPPSWTWETPDRSERT